MKVRTYHALSCWSTGRQVKNENNLDQGEGHSQGHVYICAMCGESFTQQIDLELHMFNTEHHKDNGNDRPSNIKVEGEPGTGKHLRRTELKPQE